jgi:ubiquitin-conjugating enzyme E2 M
VFNFSVTADYPHKPPKVVCKTQIYHPNINTEGAVCLNILRDEWRPVMDINQVIYGLCFLFYEPNPDDPLNREAAALFRSNKTQFASTVKRTLQGYSFEGISYPKLI